MNYYLIELQQIIFSVLKECDLNFMEEIEVKSNGDLTFYFSFQQINNKTIDIIKEQIKSDYVVKLNLINEENKEKGYWVHSTLTLKYDFHKQDYGDGEGI